MRRKREEKRVKARKRGEVHVKEREEKKCRKRSRKTVLSVRNAMFVAFSPSLS
jgi:hypothetical protein